MNERQRISTESSRASFSSCSSSVSSLDCKAEAEAPYDRILFPETPSRDAVMNQSTISPHFGCNSLDLRDVVKDSMYREARGLSLRTTAKEESAINATKHRDSPRPIQLSKSVDGSYRVGIDGKQSVPIDLKESIRVLAKLREAPWYYAETKELPRSSHEVKDGHWHSISKGAPWFPYEGKEISRLSFESRETIKSTPKLKELPRLSLDSKEGSLRSYSTDSKATHHSRNIYSGTSTSNDKFPTLQQPSATPSRPPSVVAKLMGLEALPDSSLAGDGQSSSTETYSAQDNGQFPRSSKNGLTRPLRVSNSPKMSLKDPTSPRRKNHDLVMKPIRSSRVPIEPAPWKQQDGNQSSEKLTSRAIKATARSPDSFPSVYCEIEKRLKDLEFKQSGRDLRALKRILEAMQVKGLLETREEEQALNVGNKRDYELNPSLIQHSISVRQQTARETESVKAIESPIVIMKPGKLIEKSGISASSVFPIGELSDSHKLRSGGVHAHDKRGTASNQIAKDQSLRNSHWNAPTSFSEKKENSIRTIKSAQSQPRSKQLPKENSPSSVKNSGSVSLRMQQKKLESEKQSNLPTPPSDSNNPRRQSFKQPTESGSPSQKLRPKVASSRYCDDRLSETSNELRSLSSQWDEISLQSDSITVDSKMDTEVTSSLQSAEIIESQCSSMKPIEHLVSGSMHKVRTMMISFHSSFLIKLYEKIKKISSDIFQLSVDIYILFNFSEINSEVE